MSDPQKISHQAALTTASGTSWVVVGGLIAVVCTVMLWTMRELPPLGLASWSAVAIIVQYLLMLAVRIGVASGRPRLWLLAGLTLTIVGTFIIAAGIVVFTV